MPTAEELSQPSVFIAGPVAWNLLIYLNEFPRSEPHMALANGFQRTLGGTSAGKALNLSRLGARVTLRTLIGDDAQGQQALSTLRADGVKVIAEIDPEGATEQHVNLMNAEGGRISLYLTMPKLVDTLHRGQTYAALAEADAVVLDLADSVRSLIPNTVGVGAPVWVDLHDYNGSDSFHDEFIAAGSYVFLSSDRMPDPKPFMADRIAAGARLVVCTHGAHGATAVADDGTWYQVPAVPVDRVVDTNGAGDAFFSAFLVAYLRDGDVCGALLRAAEHAARCVQSAELAPPRV